MPKVIRAVRSSGVLGKRLVTADVVYINGLEEDRTEVDSVVLKEPVDQVVTVGTAEPIQVLSSSSGGPLPAVPAALSGRWTGDSMLPVGSTAIGAYRYGYRGQSGYCHSGSRVRHGSEGGASVLRLWHSCKISHGNGIYTPYAHMSQLAVSYGDYVQQGQIIGYVGQLAMLMGNHCHFEIIINGRFMDPSKYIGTYYPGR